MMKRIFFIIVCIFLTAALWGAEASVDEEHFIYSVHAFDGSSYKKSICHEHSDTIYFLSNTDNVMSIRKAFIYFWPPMNRYRVNSSKLNYTLTGTMEIKGPNDFYKKITPRLFAHSKRNEGFSGYDVRNKEALIYFDDQARSMYDDYIKKRDYIRKADSEYLDELIVYRKWANEMNNKVRDARKAGQDVLSMIIEIEARRPQRRYIDAIDYIVEEPYDVFHINLPAGEYTIRILDDQGDVYEGSEKKLHIFNMSREKSVAYQYASKTKVLKLKYSRNPGSMIYVDGTSELFSRGAFQNQFNDFLYKKLSINESSGNPGIKRWVRTGDVQFSWLEVDYGFEKPDIVVEEHFSMVVDPNNTDVYTVDYWDGSKVSGKDPDFSAYYIPMKSNVINLKLKDYKGNILPGSFRQVRVVNKNSLHIIVLILALLPLPFMIFTVIKRLALYNRPVKD